jgi:hypothetical protein
MACYLQEVIITDNTTRGKGVEGDPVRRILQVYAKDGTLIMENDPYKNKTTIHEPSILPQD